MAEIFRLFHHISNILTFDNISRYTENAEGKAHYAGTKELNVRGLYDNEQTTQISDL